MNSLRNTIDLYNFIITNSEEDIQLFKWFLAFKMTFLYKSNIIRLYWAYECWITLTFNFFNESELSLYNSYLMFV